MSIDSENIIENIKQYLKDWNVSGQCPNRFMDKIDNLESTDDKIVVHTLGSYLYFALTNEKYNGELTHKNVKKPRIYQFLNMVLKGNKDDRESDPKFLLSILEKDDRDTIENKLYEEKYIVECFSTLGLTRLKNQDYLGFYQFDNAVLMIVADGVGGGDSGEVASQIATDFVIDSLKRYDLQEESSITDILRNIVFETNQKILNHAKKHNMGSMGTTLSIALIVEQSMLYIAHVGDSRIYELNRGKKPRQITEDHSEVEILYRLGKIEEKDKKKYKKNILRYAIGVKDLKREDIFVQEQYIHGDTALLLCSDGLWEKIDIDENLFLKDFDELKEAIYAVVPTDNVTVIRYFSVEQMDSNFKGIEESFEEEFVKEPQKEKEEIKSKVPEKKVIAKNKPLDKKTSVLKNKGIKKINQLLISFIFILIISVVTYFLIAQVFNSTEKVNIREDNDSKEALFFQYVENRDINRTKSLIDNGVDINLTDEDNNTALHYSYKNMDINMSLFLINKGVDTKRVKKEIQSDINKTKMKLEELKAFYKRVKI